ncbi:Xre family transcriptional regulator [Duganella sp. BK701]|uniref:helix-turn-helix domain-containing protein n=1 Tax=unclassified Duganella TaxID=2636909 RepID=UPI000B874E5E|nr:MULTISPECIES: helix-turn-helix transcriptional regulator [unclassified Duganella]RZT08750.1 Xre family transcriptional regulator [Duganella sp. BK701]
MSTIFINGVPIELGSGNVYADLGYPDAEDMLVKAGLVHQIQQIIDSKGLTQQQAAKQINVEEAWLSDLLDGKFRNIDTSTIMKYLEQLAPPRRE